MDSQEIPPELLSVLTQGIEVIEEPFAPLASACGMNQEELLEQLRELLEEGVIRRFGAVLNHLAAGVSANVMVVWRVSEEEVERIGKIMASFPAVSHCYERPPLPDFPYNLYSMVHGSSWEECDATIEEISRQTGITEFVCLRTVKEFKKSSPQI